MTKAKKLDATVERLVRAARRHVVAFGKSRGIRTMNHDARELRDMERAEANLRRSIRRALAPRPPLRGT